MSFLHTTPTGRIINRLTKDTSDIDRNLAGNVSFFFRAFLQLMSTVTLIAVGAPFALPALVVMMGLFWMLYGYYIASMRQAKRLEAVSRLLNQSLNRWLSVRLEGLGAFCTLIAALVTVEQQSASAAAMGLLLTYALQITASTSMTLRSGSIAEQSFNAVERVDEYRPGLPLVLRGLSFQVEAGFKVGVVGRTGAGKSSLIGALFRLTEIESGFIKVDGVDTKTLGLRRLRSAMALIPQV
eukprot:gene14677-14830_t